MNLNQNLKLIKKLEKKPLEAPANLEPVQPDLSLSAPSLDADDPVTRLVTELSDLRKQVKFLTGTIQEREKKGAPLTLAQVEALINEMIQSGLFYKIDSEEIIQSLLPELANHGKKAVFSIEDATYQASKQMSAIYEREAKKWNARIGFTSWKAAVAILGSALLIVAGSIWYAATQHERRSAIEAQLTESKADNDFLHKYFVWIKEKYPKVWESYKTKLEKPTSNQSKGQRGK
jgi:hypothetical protein